MEIIVVGCGRLGSELAYRLYKDGHDVAIVDLNSKAYDILPSDFIGRTYDGNALNKEILVRAGIETAQALVTVTNDDAANLVISRIAKTIYNVPHVIARNFDPKLSSYYDLFDIEVVSSTKWGAQRTLDLIMNPKLPLVHSAIDGEVNIYKLDIPKTWIGKSTKDILATYKCNLVAINREGNTFVPGEKEVLINDDVLLVSASKEDFKEIQSGLRL